MINNYEKNHNPKVYFFYNPITNFIKIGVTENLRRRLNTISTQSGMKLYCIHYLQEVENVNYYKNSLPTKTLEKYLHWVFEEYKMIGEWFYLSDSISRFINETKVYRDKKFSWGILNDIKETATKYMDKKFPYSELALAYKLIEKNENSVDVYGYTPQEFIKKYIEYYNLPFTYYHFLQEENNINNHDVLGIYKKEQRETYLDNILEESNESIKKLLLVKYFVKDNFTD